MSDIETRLAAIEADIRYLRDRREIEDVVHGLARGTDRFDVEIMTDSFTDDGFDDHASVNSLGLTAGYALTPTWTAGLFYFENEDTYETYIDNAGGLRFGGSSAPTYSYAAFADGTYELFDDFFVTAGLRYARDEVRDAYYNQRFIVTPVYADDYSKDTITPRLVFRYKPSVETSIYASYSKGYKAGVIDVGGESTRRVSPEDIDAFELGFKYGDGRLSFEAAAFYYDYKDLQVSIFTDAAAQILNAAKSEIYGLDGQVNYRFSDNFSVFAGGTYVHARYKKFGFVENGVVNGAPLYASCPSPATPKYAGTCTAGQIYYVNTDTILEDVRMQRVPEFTGNIGARYTTALAGGELALSGNLYYTSDFFFSPSGTQFYQGDYEVLSLRGQWTDPTDHMTLAVFGDNVTNSRYRTQVQYNNFGIGATYSQPVTYGVELGIRF